MTSPLPNSARKIARERNTTVMLRSNVSTVELDVGKVSFATFIAHETISFSENSRGVPVSLKVLAKLCQKLLRVGNSFL